MGQDGGRFHQVTQNGAQFKTYKVFSSGIFHLRFLDNSWSLVNEIIESETADGGGNYCMWILFLLFLHALVCFGVQILSERTTLYLNFLIFGVILFPFPVLYPVSLCPLFLLSLPSTNMKSFKRCARFWV